MTLQEFNQSTEQVAHAALVQCCGSKRWSGQMLARRPFQDRETLLSTAESVWWTLSPDDWLEAFSAHPRIGQKKLSNWSSQEQAGVNSASAQLLERLAAGNREYERRFGWIFLICASCKSATEMLDALQDRLGNEPGNELRVAAAEQAKIAQLRLNKLLNP